MQSNTVSYTGPHCLQYKGLEMVILLARLFSVRSIRELILYMVEYWRGKILVNVCLPNFRQ